MKARVDNIEEAQHLTALSLAQMIQTTEELSRLHLDDVTELAEEVSRVVPAGNVVTMVLSQLSSIKGRRVSENETRRMLGLLNKGMATFMDRAAYLTFFTTPALLISGYQLLLKAAGKDPGDAFPNGTWQFYLEFGLREDTGRHACETTGFHQEILQYDLSDSDVLAAWIMASSWQVLSYERLLTQEWNERRLLRELTLKTEDDSVSKAWLTRRPYDVPPDSGEDYVIYRRNKFSEFVRNMLALNLRQSQVDKTIEAWNFDTGETLQATARQVYLEQMSILSRLDPGEFNDVRQPLDPNDCYIGILYKGNYYLIPVLHYERPLDYTTIRALAQGILSTDEYNRKYKTNLDQLLITIPRRDQNDVREQLPTETLQELERLQRAPVLLNWDEAPGNWTLSDIRNTGRRSIGDHALTIFRTDRSFVFDQSHIFFDAIWGMAVSEIVTNHATRYARAIASQETMDSGGIRPAMVRLEYPNEFTSLIRRHADVSAEVSAETVTGIVPEINELRRLLRKRNEDIHITVNDFLVLYRSLFNQFYEPGSHLMGVLEDMTTLDEKHHRMVSDIRTMFKNLRETRPAFLIPMDASAINPGDRIFPVTFRPQPPWTEISEEHEKAHALLMECQLQAQPSRATWKAFYDARNHYLEMLRMFGVLMARYKEIALSGESFSTATLKILASVPRRLQPMFRNIPDRIDILNDMLKGTEVFSNAGRVAEESSLTRFITAKDDNKKKTLCWGVMTRADDTMVISLRDFRAPVGALLEAGKEDVARMITRDFLDSYAVGLEVYIRELTEMVKSSRRRR